MAQRRIATAADLSTWRVSPAYASLIDFITKVAAAVQGRILSDPCSQSPGIQAVVAVLDRIDQITTETPPIQQPSRFGNPAFRTWHTRLTEMADELIEQLAPGARLQSELRAYLLDSFGNATRIDYGSGHELSFVVMLVSLLLKGVLLQTDMAAVCLVVFTRYLALVRRVQQTYRLEPAGSHGVWGLDDFQFLPFYWGASQLIGSGIKPAQLADKATALRYGDDYMFFGCIQFIYAMKSGPFHEHSRVLYDISAVAEWSKVCSGLLKMYEAEVLMKLPIVQHLPFTATFSFDAAPGMVPVVLPDRPLPAGLPVAGAIAPQTTLGRISGTGGPASGSLRRPPPRAAEPPSPVTASGTASAPPSTVAPGSAT